MKNTGSSQAKEIGHLFWLTWIALVIVYIVCRMNSIAIPLERDEGLFGYIGQVILDHGLPYRDVIDHKPPLVYYIYAFALLCVPPTAKGIHIFLLAYNFITLIVLYFLGKEYSGSRSTGLWTAFTFAVFSTSPSIQGYTASTEMFMLLPATVSLYCAVRAVCTGRLYFVMLSGLCSALAFWIKHTGLFLVLFSVVYMLSAFFFGSARHVNKLRVLVTGLFLWLTGFCFVSMLICGYFYYQGMFVELMYWGFAYNYYYGKAISIVDILPRVCEILQAILTGNIVIIGVGLCSGLLCIYRKNRSGYFSLTFLAFSVLSTVPGYAYNHYFAQIAPAAAVAAGSGFACIADVLQRKKIKIYAIIFLAAAAVVPPFFLYSDYYFYKSPDELSRDFFGLNPFPEAVDIGEYITQRTEKNDRIFIFGSEAEILFYAQRRSATPFALIYPLMRVIYPHYLEYQKRVWDDITHSKPRYIISAEVPTSLLWDGKADLWLYRQLQKILEEDYYLEAAIPITKPRSTLIVDMDRVNLRTQVKRYKYAVYIYRKK